MTLPSDYSKPDARIAPIVTSLEKITLEEFQNKTFVNEDVHLDGRHFHDCSFIRCRIFVTLGHFLFTASGKTDLKVGENEFIFLPPSQAVKEAIETFQIRQR